MLIQLISLAKDGFLSDVMNRSFAVSSRAVYRVNQPSVAPSGASTQISSSSASCWAYAAAASAMPSFTHTTNAWVAAGTATGVAHTKRSPQRLGESLT